MNEPVYTISQASSLVGVKSYVLRYWEDELLIPISRNDMGHRYYTGNDIQLFLNIKELKKRGLQLRAIKDLIPKLYHQEPGSSESPIKLLPGENNTSNDSARAPVVDAQDITDTFDSSQPTRDLNEYKMQEFQAILEKLISQGMKEKTAMEREQRCRSLDETIRFHQLSRRQVAATSPAKKKRRKKLFGRKKQN